MGAPGGLGKKAGSFGKRIGFKKSCRPMRQCRAGEGRVTAGSDGGCGSMPPRILPLGALDFVGSWAQPRHELGRGLCVLSPQGLPSSSHRAPGRAPDFLFQGVPVTKGRGSLLRGGLGRLLGVQRSQGPCLKVRSQPSVPPWPLLPPLLTSTALPPPGRRARL